MDRIHPRLRKKMRGITAVFFIASGALAATWASRIPNVQQKLELNNAAWGRVLVSLPSGLITGLLIASWLIVRFGVHRVLVVSTLASAVMLGIVGFAESTVQMVFALFFLGMSRTIMNMAVNTRSVELQRHYDHPIVSTFHGLWSLACFLLAAVGTWMIIQDISTGMHFVAVSVACALVGILYRRNPDERDHTPPEKRPFLVKPDRYLALLGATAFCAMLCENTVFDWSVNYFNQVVKAEKGWVTAGYTSFILSMTAGRLLGDKMIERFGPLAMLKANGLLLSAGFFVVALFPFTLPAAAGFLLIGLGDSIVIPIVYSLAGKTKKMSPGYALSAVTMIGYLGFITGPLLIGSISQWLGMQWAMGLVGIIGLGVVLMAWRVSKEAR